MNRKLHAILFVLVLLLVGAPAQAQQQSYPKSPTGSSLVVVVSIADRRLALVENGAVKKVYRVAVGKQSTPSPTGTFAVISRVSDPTYYHEGKAVAPRRGNPVGTRWIGLSLKGYGIHGTNAPNSIGKAASHGCIFGWAGGISKNCSIW
jgi:lipoprotein-anchoring transpeptidase ErfK/SrfK